MKEIDYNTVLTKIIYLTKRNDITQAEIGEACGLNKAAANKRAKRNSKFSDDEIQEIEKFFHVSLKDVDILNNTDSEYFLKPDYNLGIQFDFDEWGKRLLMLQVASGMLDSEAFSKYVDISPKRLDDFIRKNKYPSGEELLKLKIRFSKTNFDWLLFGKK